MSVQLLLQTDLCDLLLSFQAKLLERGEVSRVGSSVLERVLLRHLHRNECRFVGEGDQPRGSGLYRRIVLDDATVADRAQEGVAARGILRDYYTSLHCPPGSPREALPANINRL